MGIEVKGKLSLDGAGWSRSIEKAQEETSRFAEEGIGTLKTQIAEAFTVGAIEEFARTVVETVTKIKEMSEQSGVSTTLVQQLGHAAARVGLEFEDVARALSKFGAARKEAGEHEGAMLHNLQKYGVTLEDIRNPMLGNVDILLKMKEAMEEMAKTAQGRQELREFFGKGGDKLGAVMEQLQTMGKIELINDHQLSSIDKANKKLEDFWVTVKALAAQHAATILDVATGQNLKDIDKAFADLLGQAVTQAATGKSGGEGSAAAGTETGTIFNRKEDKSLWDELHKAEEENRYAGLTHEQKLNELVKERAEIVKRLATDTGDAAIKDQTKLVNLDTREKELRMRKTELGLKPGDALTRTGNFLGASTQSIVSIGEQTNNLLRIIANNTKPGNSSVNGNLSGSAFTYLGIGSN